MPDINQNVNIRISQQGAQQTGAAIDRLAQSQRGLGAESIGAQQKLRQFYMEQRVQDRTIRESNQAVMALAFAFGGSGGLGKTLGPAIMGMQQAEFSFKAIGISAEQAGGKLANFGSILSGAAGPAGAAAGITFGVIALVKTMAEEISSLTEKILALDIQLGKSNKWEVMADKLAKMRGKAPGVLEGLEGAGMGATVPEMLLNLIGTQARMKREANIQLAEKELQLEIKTTQEKEKQVKAMGQIVAGKGGPGGPWSMPSGYNGPFFGREFNASPWMAEPQGRRGMGALAGVGEGSAGAMMGQTIAKINQEFALLNDASIALGDTLRYSLGSAFEDIFGEANSLLEQFAARMFELLAERAIGSLLSMIPGVGPVIGAAVSGGYGLASTSNIQGAERRMSSGPGMRLIQMRNEKQRARYAV